jgi:hypothetical protein
MLVPHHVSSDAWKHCTCMPTTRVHHLVMLMIYESIAWYVMRVHSCSRRRPKRFHSMAAMTEWGQTFFHQCQWTECDVVARSSRRRPKRRQPGITVTSFGGNGPQPGDAESPVGRASREARRAGHPSVTRRREQDANMRFDMCGKERNETFF